MTNLAGAELLQTLNGTRSRVRDQWNSQASDSKSGMTCLNLNLLLPASQWSRLVTVSPLKRLDIGLGGT